MKYLNYEEVKLLIARLKSLSGALLVSVRQDSPIMILEFSNEKSSHFFLLDMSSSCPVAMIFEKLPLIKFNKNNAKPISLFLKAHFINKKLMNVSFADKKGRVVDLQFEGGLGLEIRLFPHGQNIIAVAEKKSIALNKPKALVEREGSDSLIVFQVRSEDEIKREWLEKQQAKMNRSKELRLKSQENKSKTQLIIEKLSLEILKYQEEIVSLREQIKKTEAELTILSSDSTTRKLGELHEALKIIKHKVKRLFDRKTEVQIQEPRSQTAVLESSAGVLKKKNREESPKGKRWVLPSGATAIVGRNAGENVELLRKAKPWDIWLHLRDYPGSYGFIYKNRTQKIESDELQQVAVWVAKMSLKNKAKKMAGEKIDMIFTECRFLQLIKGDRLGRVQYKNSKTLRVQMPKGLTD